MTPWLRRYGFLIPLAVIALDQFTKWLVARSIPLHENRSVIPGFFWLSHVENQGAAFGLFSDSPSSLRLSGLVLFSLIAIGVVLTLLLRGGSQLWSTRIALLLVLGGASGNLWDRLLFGHVVDFFEFHIGSYHWPDFNVADSAIVVGALLILGEILFAKSAPLEDAIPKNS